MDTLDALIAAKASKPSGILSGEVPVWNGSTWVRSSVTNVGPTSLGSGTPDATKFLRGDGVWAAASPKTYRKTSATAATNTVTETDLLAGAITAAAGDLGTTGVLRLTMWGDWIQSSGGSVGLPRFKVKLGAGATVVLDTNTLAGASATTGSRYPWRAVVEVMNLGATNVQLATLDLRYGVATTGVGMEQNFTTGEGVHGYVGTASTAMLAQALGYNSAAIDTTAAMAVAFTIINPSATSTETKLFGALAEII